MFQCIKRQKAKKWIFLQFATVIGETIGRTEIFIKQKMQGAESFGALLSATQGDGERKKELRL